MRPSENADEVSLFELKNAPTMPDLADNISIIDDSACVVDSLSKETVDIRESEDLNLKDPSDKTPSNSAEGADKLIDDIDTGKERDCLE